MKIVKYHLLLLQDLLPQVAAASFGGDRHAASGD